MIMIDDYDWWFWLMIESMFSSAVEAACIHPARFERRTYILINTKGVFVFKIRQAWSKTPTSRRAIFNRRRTPPNCSHNASKYSFWTTTWFDVFSPRVPKDQSPKGWSRRHNNASLRFPSSRQSSRSLYNFTIPFSKLALVISGSQMTKFWPVLFLEHGLGGGGWGGGGRGKLKMSSVWTASRNSQNNKKRNALVIETIINVA